MAKNPFNIYGSDNRICEFSMRPLLCGSYDTSVRPVQHNCMIGGCGGGDGVDTQHVELAQLGLLALLVRALVPLS